MTRALAARRQIRPAVTVAPRHLPPARRRRPPAGGIVSMAPRARPLAGNALHLPVAAAAAATSWSARPRRAAPAPEGGLRAACRAQAAQVEALDGRLGAASAAARRLNEEQARLAAWQQRSDEGGGRPAFTPDSACQVGDGAPLADAAAAQTYAQALDARQQGVASHLEALKKICDQAHRQLAQLISMWAELLKKMHETAMAIIANLR